jgi:DNA-binding LacI/PurR family transcriptional regulator
MITLKDIAEVAGVSISTVSRVMNNKSSISEETKQRIYSAAQELKFKQGIVSQISTDRTYSVALIVPGKDEFYHDDPKSSADVRSIQAVFEHAGHRVEVYVNNGLDELPVLMTQIKKDKIEGVLLSDLRVGTKLPDELVKEGIPFVVTNGLLSKKNVYQVDYDNYKGMVDLVEAVIAKGHRKIGLISGPTDHMVNRNRMDALEKTFQSHGIALNWNCVTSGPFSLETGYENGNKLLAEHPELTVFICLSDYIAMGAMKAAREKGLSIPLDLSITGFDNIEMASYVEPPLTTVHRFDKDSSYLIAQALLQQLEYPGIISYGKIFLNTTYIERASLGAPRN